MLQANRAMWSMRVELNPMLEWTPAGRAIISHRYYPYPTHCIQSHYQLPSGVTDICAKITDTSPIGTACLR